MRAVPYLDTWIRILNAPGIDESSMTSRFGWIWRDHRSRSRQQRLPYSLTLKGLWFDAATAPLSRGRIDAPATRRSIISERGARVCP